MVTRIFAALALLGFLGMAGCSNTFEGAGKDIDNAGDAIERSVD